MIRSNIHSQIDHLQQTQELISRVALGAVNPWGNEEFLALRSGFNFVIRLESIEILDGPDDLITPGVNLFGVCTNKF